uniref:BED-type domain-containing protein n=1 Tax=Ditylenchus dipsaci TaxID=166011 RepID=A0A915DWE4_9BILA
MSSTAESSPLSQSSVESKARVVSRRGQIWSNFTEEIDATGCTIVVCRECKQVFKHPSMASTLSYHWIKKHPNKEQPPANLRRSDITSRPRTKVEPKCGVAEKFRYAQVHAGFKMRRCSEISQSSLGRFAQEQFKEMPWVHVDPDYDMLVEGDVMPEKMINFAFHELTKIRKHNGEDDWPRLLQEAFNSAFPPNGWNCLIGRDFTAEFFNTDGCLLVFGIGQTHRGVLFRLF